MSTLLRLATAGSVDDGKSTLVGRLLHDTKNVLVDQMAAVERVSAERGLTAADLALLTDGLRAEREQGITIDVAYRYFATEKRNFILADCPGHVQYTRNTVTGSSTADVIVMLVDARKGVLEQTRRHLAVAALLRVPHVVVAVNKIDLLDYDPEPFAEIERQIEQLVSVLQLTNVHTLPVSALAGDNIATRSERTPWYTGPALLELLESLPSGTDPALEDFRLPVQLVLRPQEAAVSPDLVEYRGYAGQISAGVVRPGDEVVVLPNGQRTTVVGIDTADGELTEAFAPQSVSLRLADELDIARGDMIAAAQDAPEPTLELDAMLCWIAEEQLHPGARVLLKHTSRTVQAKIETIHGRLDLESLGHHPADHLALNDIGRVTIKLARPILAEPYETSRRGGAFLLVDAVSGKTLAAGMVSSDVHPDETSHASTIEWEI
ncbi:sulfate adenylyltransferase subunit 1 [Aeromicrobium sp. CF3.5]|uniref:sulfate adenylyltransferase subunit 1 n=1 Tax=Aeromicrobium sp. CF3.5 TaxID=3373078 RepID=UPI003EE57FB2